MSRLSIDGREQYINTFTIPTALQILHGMVIKMLACCSLQENKCNEQNNTENKTSSYQSETKY